jgi:PleD family two-component response regulator
LSRPGDSTSSILQRADAALYRAKASGRNRVMCELPPHPRLQEVH